MTTTLKRLLIGLLATIVPATPALAKKKKSPPPAATATKGKERTRRRRRATSARTKARRGA